MAIETSTMFPIWSRNRAVFSKVCATFGALSISTALRVVASVFVVGTTALIGRADECSAVITNRTCTVTIDRESPSSPLPIRVHSGQVVTIKVSKRPLEKIVFDTKFIDVAKPDPFSAIFSSFLKPLGALVLSTNITKGPSKPLRQPSCKDLDDVLKSEPVPVQNLLKELCRIAQLQTDVTLELGGFRTTIKDAAKGFTDNIQNLKAGEWDPGKIKVTWYKTICAIDASPDTPLDSKYGCGPSDVGVGHSPLPSGSLKTLDDAVTAAVKVYESTDFTGADKTVVDECARLLNTTVANETVLNDNLKTIQSLQVSIVQAASVLEQTDVDKLNVADSKDLIPGGRGVDRSATVTITAQDLVSKSTTNLVTVTVVWGGTSWEMSTGVLLSMLPNRSFQNSPIIINGKPSLDTSGKVNTVVTQTTTIPTVVPIFLGHYRICEHVVSERRIGFSVTGGVGINPYSGVADFGVGATLEYRNFMLSPLLHFGRDLRLTNGLAVGEQLGSSPPTLTTERYWVRKFGISISYRLPIN
jgi:hypothetical protein